MKRFNKHFIVLLLINLFVFSLIPLVRSILPIDAVEGIVWGSYWDFGTHKHPPLSGWLSYIFYNYFGQKDFVIYFLGQLFSTIGLIYIYKLGKLFLSEKKAILSAIIMLGCFPYTCMSTMDGFNPNFIMFITFPAITYYFYNCLKQNKIYNWFLLGIFVGISSLAKYQTLMLLIPMLVYAIIFKNARNCFKSKGLYISIIIAFLIFLPHLIWLINHDFLSFNYFIIESDIYSHAFGFDLKRFIVAPLVLLSKTLGILAGTLVIFGILYCKFRNNDKSFSQKNDDKWFILIMGLGPVLLQIIPVLGGSQVVATWIYPMLGMFGILLFYFFNINEEDSKLMFWAFNIVYIVVCIIAIVLFILFSVELNFRSKYNETSVANTIKTAFYNETGKDLKYVAGYLEFVCPITVYDKTHPKIILDTYGYKNPWINEQDVKDSGVVIVYRSKRNIKENVKQLLPYIKDENIGENKYFNFTIKNIYGGKRTYDATYLIVKPEKQ